MSHLLVISIGPVQEFIAAARRTSDLYAGSNLISEIAKASATAIQQAGGDLIFPARPEDGAANKIFAEVTGDPQAVADAAKSAAKRHLRNAWNDAYGKLKQQQAHIDHILAEQQINTFLEFYAAWWPWNGSDDGYQEARQMAEFLLAGRKTLRDFKQPPKNPGLPKSPLDPSRDTVVTNIAACELPPLRLKGNEWLDAVSVLKRVRGWSDEDKVPSTADIAARTLELKMERGDEQAQKQLALLRSFSKPGFLGSFVFENLRQEILDEEAAASGTPVPKAQAIRNAEAAFQECGKRIPESDPYFAILVADGDGMGDLIGRMKSKEEHKTFSRELAAFAQSAKSTVEGYKGHLVYSGGDDVLALLPVHTALCCAARLAKEFRGTIQGGTLSVGIAIVHYHEPLQVSLRQAREAENVAKCEGKNRLALAFYPRSGQERVAVWKWEDGHDYSHWKLWIEAFQKGLSHGFPYELEKLAQETEGINLSIELLRGEALRIFDRKKKSETANPQMDVAKIHTAFGAISGHEELAKLAQCLIIFRNLARYPMQWEVNP